MTAAEFATLPDAKKVGASRCSGTEIKRTKARASGGLRKNVPDPF